LPENILLHKKMVVVRKLENEDLHDFGYKIDSMCHDTASYLLGENRICKLIERQGIKIILLFYFV
jgi:hypothetical protein